jgi:hypothetical protein
MAFISVLYIVMAFDTHSPDDGVLCTRVDCTQIGKDSEEPVEFSVRRGLGDRQGIRNSFETFMNLSHKSSSMTKMNHNQL